MDEKNTEGEDLLMLGLIYKDIIVNKKTFLLTLLGLAFFNSWIYLPIMLTDHFLDDMKAFPMLLQGMFLMMTVASFYIGGMIEDGFPAHDESKKWAYYIASTENGVKNFVGSKYMLCVLFTTVLTFFCICMNNICFDVLGEEAPAMENIIIPLFFVQLLFRAVSYPFIFAFGSKIGNNVKVVALLAIVAAFLIYLMFGDLSYISDHSDELWDKFFDLITNVGSSWKIMMWESILCFAVLPLYYLSYRISCKVYMKGVERFER